MYQRVADFVIDGEQREITLKNRGSQGAISTKYLPNPLLRCCAVVLADGHNEVYHIFYHKKLLLTTIKCLRFAKNSEF